MLKEAAMEYFVENAQDVMATKGFEQVAESPDIMREMMAVGFGGNKKRPASSDAYDDDDRDYKRMRVDGWAGECHHHRHHLPTYSEPGPSSRSSRAWMTWTMAWAIPTSSSRCCPFHRRHDYWNYHHRHP